MGSTERSSAEGILFTDQYQLTMAQLYFRTGMHERPAQFDHFFRDYPNYGLHQSGYCINAGLDWLLEWMGQARFGEAEIEYLRWQTGGAGQRLFDDDFLAWLRDNGTFDGISLKAVPEGRVVHANVPLTIVQGPLAMAQILETALLNHLNYQTLIATKASRIREAGRGRMVLEFGLRRGPERGANAGTRAALIGGADFSSNVGVSRMLGLPPKGTHAHSMVQVFIALEASELDAFRAYADVFPDDCLLLVDTVDTLGSGIPNAIRVFEELRQKGHRPVGIRLDSGDLAYLSIRAARMLDQAGFPEVSIVLSNQIDELTLWQIITQIEVEAPQYGVEPDKLIRRLVYGVGTRLISSAGDSALDGVYKLVAVFDQGRWLPAIKISETPEKTPNPGHKRVWRLYDRRGRAIADLLGLEDEDPRELDPLVTHHPTQFGAERSFRHDEISQIEPLLMEVFREGRRVSEPPSLDDMRALRASDLDRLYPGVRRLMKPHVYHVSLTKKLWDYKQELIAAVKRKNSST
ncbi:MAG TPA: nicotinate phosphoribosyltransferase [Anaerolineales bacterium]|nr:MAG: nicotinate phosphoribosyltransferase [Chloroflexi bacterium RBG_19FT_COMBO_62_14]HLE05435.1 nicotinate phosphoribosyltransferase [Anaerolineales bacterium]